MKMKLTMALGLVALAVSTVPGCAGTMRDADEGN